MRATPGRSLARHQRLYRTMLLAYPRAFRQVYGADMVQVFGDRLRDEHERRGRRASLRVWFLTLLDLFKTAPLQRMEKKMTREAAFAVVVALAITAAAAFLVTDSGGPIALSAAGLLVVAVIAFVVKGTFTKGRAKGSTPAGKFGLRDWWVVLAFLLGLVEIGMITGQLIDNPKWENALAFAIVGGLGAVALTGTWLRSRSRRTGDWMIVVGVLPLCAMFWAVWPPVVVLTVIVMALIDSTRRDPDDASAESPSDAMA